MSWGGDVSVSELGRGCECVSELGRGCECVSELGRGCECVCWGRGLL